MAHSKSLLKTVGMKSKVIAIGPNKFESITQAKKGMRRTKECEERNAKEMNTKNKEMRRTKECEENHGMKITLKESTIFYNDKKILIYFYYTIR